MKRIFFNIIKNIKIIFLGIFCSIVLYHCAAPDFYSIEDIEKEKRKMEEGKNKSAENLLEIYNDKRQEYDGLAFAQINRGCCENCYSSLPPQLVIDVNSCNQFVSCPTCSILLYLEDIDLDN